MPVNRKVTAIAKKPKPVPIPRPKSTPALVPTQLQEHPATPTPAPSRPKPTPPGYSKEALQLRAALEVAELKRVDAEVAAKAAANRLDAEGDRLATEATRLAAEVAQANLLANTIAAAVPPSYDTSASASATAPPPFSCATTPAAPEEVLSRSGRQITRTTGGVENAKRLEMKEAKSKKAAETRAKKIAAKRVAEDAHIDEGPKKKARVSSAGKKSVVKRKQ